MRSTLLPLTARQQEIFQFIRRHVQENGYPPTIRGIGRAVQINSPNGVLCHLKALEHKGWIERPEKGLSRSLRLRGYAVPSLPCRGEVS